MCCLSLCWRKCKSISAQRQASPQAGRWLGPWGPWCYCVCGVAVSRGLPWAPAAAPHGWAWTPACRGRQGPAPPGVLRTAGLRVCLEFGV